MAGFDDIIRQVMQGLGATVPSDDYRLPQLPAEPMRVEPQELYAATPLNNEIAPGNKPQTMVDPQGNMTPYARSRMDNPMMGFDTGGVGAIRAYHGSPHKFDRFDMSKIGTGEGAQAFTRGLYFAGNENVARGYRDRLSPWNVDPTHADEMFRLSGEADRHLKQAQSYYEDATIAFMDHGLNSPQYKEAMRAYDNAATQHLAVKRAIDKLPGTSAGHMYEVNLDVDPGQLLQYNKPFSRQSSDVQRAVRDVGFKGGPDTTGENIINDLMYRISARDNPMRTALLNRQTPQTLAHELNNAGVPGLQYLDAGSRSRWFGKSHNTVMYRDDLINLLRRYGIAGGAVGAAAGGASQQDQPQ